MQYLQTSITVKGAKLILSILNAKLCEKLLVIVAGSKEPLMSQYIVISLQSEMSLNFNHGCL